MDTPTLQHAFMLSLQKGFAPSLFRPPADVSHSVLGLKNQTPRETQVKAAGLVYIHKPLSLLYCTGKTPLNLVTTCAAPGSQRADFTAKRASLWVYIFQVKMCSRSIFPPNKPCPYDFTHLQAQQNGSPTSF